MTMYVPHKIVSWPEYNEKVQEAGQDAQYWTQTVGEQNWQILIGKNGVAYYPQDFADKIAEAEEKK